MSGRVDAKLKELGISLPAPTQAVANYVSWVKSGSHIYISGQIPIGPEGLMYAGIVGKDISLEDARKAARLCAINILAALKSALDGDLDRVKRCVKLNGFVNAAAGFGQHPEVLNGASDIMVQVFGEAGRHARAAVGAGSLPRNISVEVDAVFEVE
jgi:enamine deaminase RidA (YjgF/YER057c/UK114 family)